MEISNCVFKYVVFEVKSCINHDPCGIFRKQGKWRTSCNYPAGEGYEALVLTGGSNALKGIQSAREYTLFPGFLVRL